MTQDELEKEVKREPNFDDYKKASGNRDIESPEGNFLNEHNHSFRVDFSLVLLLFAGFGCFFLLIILILRLVGG